MKLANYQWNNTLDWDEHHSAELILEDPHDYLNVVKDLSNQWCGDEGEMILSENGKIFSLKKDGLFIRDLWNLELTQKKIQNSIYQKLSLIAQEEYYTEFADLVHEIDTLIGHLSQDSMLALEWTLPVELSPVLKMIALNPEVSEEPFDRLIDYVHLSQEFLHIKFIVLVGMRSYLTDDEYRDLCKDFSCAEIPVLFIEPFCRNYIEGSIRMIIDKDHCEILIG